jgi:hypothetical protein
MGDEAAVDVTAAGSARELVRLSDAAAVAIAPGSTTYPQVLKARAQYWNAVDPAPRRSTEHPLDLVFGRRKRRSFRLKQDRLSKRAVPLRLGRCILRKDSSLADRRRLVPRIDDARPTKP